MSDSLRLKDQPINDRPRERLAAKGAEALSNADLIAILLRTGLKGANAVQVGQQLLNRFGSLQALARASVADLQKTKGIGRDKAVTLMKAKNLVKNVETLQVLSLNTRHRLVRVDEIADGTLDTILVHPREVFKPAIAANASAIVLAHNHPSGDPAPSEADIKVTRDLIRVGQLLKIEVLDHVILGRATPERPKEYASLKELGYFAG